MTATDPLTPPDALALLVALDEGDDSALLPLADLLEEAGDPRAAGLRLIGDRRPLGEAHVGASAPAWTDRVAWRHQSGFLPADTFAALQGGWASSGGLRSYLCRSAALLALAEALAG